MTSNSFLGDGNGSVFFSRSTGIRALMFFMGIHMLLSKNQGYSVFSVGYFSKGSLKLKINGDLLGFCNFPSSTRDGAAGGDADLDGAAERRIHE